MGPEPEAESDNIVSPQRRGGRWAGMLLALGVVLLVAIGGAVGFGLGRAGQSSGRTDSPSISPRPSAAPTRDLCLAALQALDRIDAAYGGILTDLGHDLFRAKADPGRARAVRHALGAMSVLAVELDQIESPPSLELPHDLLAKAIAKIADGFENLAAFLDDGSETRSSSAESDIAEASELRSSAQDRLTCAG
jgi:hypothetical protein